MLFNKKMKRAPALKPVHCAEFFVANPTTPLRASCFAKASQDMSKGLTSVAIGVGGSTCHSSPVLKRRGVCWRSRIILIGLICTANGSVCMSPGIDCKVAETIGDKTRLIGEFSSDELAFMRLMSLTEGVMAVAYPDQMQLQIRKLPDASPSSSSSFSQAATSASTSTVQEAAPVLQQTIATLCSCMARAIPAEVTPSTSVVSEKSVTVVADLKRSSTASSLASIMRPYALTQHAALSSMTSTAAREQERISLSQVFAEQASRLTAEFHEDVKESKETSAYRFNGVSSGEDLSEFMEHWSLRY